MTLKISFGCIGQAMSIMQKRRALYAYIQLTEARGSPTQLIQQKEHTVSGAFTVLYLVVLKIFHDFNKRSTLLTQ